MKFKSSDFTAGLFVIGGLFAIITMFFVVKGQLNKQDSYHSYFNNVAGLRAGASVVYEGYIIGTVNEITPEQTDTGMTFRVDIGVQENWAIPSDSMAEIAALSLLSAQSIQIVAGTDTPLAPGALIPSRPATNLMADLGRTADQFAQIASQSLVPLLSTIDQLLQEEAKLALTGLADLSVTVSDGVPALLETANRTVENLEKASENVVSLSGDETKAAVNVVLGDMVEASGNVNDATKTIGTLATTADDMVSNVAQTVESQWLADVAALLGRIDNAAANLEEISQSALASADNIEKLTGQAVQGRVLRLLDNVDKIRTNLERASEAVVIATNNAADVSDISEDRIEAFLQKLESAALNVEEMTARLRDDPSIIIRGSN